MTTPSGAVLYRRRRHARRLWCDGRAVLQKAPERECAEVSGALLVVNHFFCTSEGSMDKNLQLPNERILFL